MNLNVKTRRTQLAILIGVLAAAGVTTALVLTFGTEDNKAQQAQNAPAPNMTGVVTATFDEQVNQSAMAQQQARTSALEAQLAQLAQSFEQSKTTFSQQLQKKDAEIQRLSEQMQTKPGATGSNEQPSGQAHRPPPVPPVRRAPDSIRAAVAIA